MSAAASPVRNVLLLPGDGIGPEVIAETRRVMDWMTAHRGVQFAIEQGLVGGAAIDAEGALGGLDQAVNVVEALGFLDTQPVEQRKNDERSEEAHRATAPVGIINITNSNSIKLVNMSIYGNYDPTVSTTFNAGIADITNRTRTTGASIDKVDNHARTFDRRE